jgi:hypothetical protein
MAIVDRWNRPGAPGSFLMKLDPQQGDVTVQSWKQAATTKVERTTATNGGP